MQLVRLFFLIFLIIASTRAADDFYSVLGVSRDADGAALKRAFRKVALKHHPDKQQGSDGEREEAQRQFILASRAFEVLSDPDKRKIYNVHGEKGLESSAGTGGGHSAGSGAYGYGANYGHFTDPMDLFSSLFGGAGGNMRVFVDGFGNMQFAFASSHTQRAQQQFGSRTGFRSSTSGDGARAPASLFAQSPLRGASNVPGRGQGSIFSSFSSMVHLDEGKLDADVLDATARGDMPWLVFYYASWCRHAEEMAPLVEQLAEELNGFIKVASMDVGDSAISSRLRIEMSPTLRLYSADGPEQGEEWRARPSLRALATFTLRRMPLHSRAIDKEAQVEALASDCAAAACGCALLLTNRTTVPPLYKAVAQALHGQTVFAHVLGITDAHHALASKLGANGLPWLGVTKSRPDRMRAYTGRLDVRSLVKYIKTTACQ